MAKTDQKKTTKKIEKGSKRTKTIKKVSEPKKEKAKKDKVI